MANLADIIEQYIQKLLKAEQETLLLQRNDVAETMGCAPSQVSYVLSTRFTIERGYTVESRKGNGGYIRITRIPIEQVVEHINNQQERWTRERLEAWRAILYKQGIINEYETNLLDVVFEEVGSRSNEQLAIESTKAVLRRLIVLRQF